MIACFPLQFFDLLAVSSSRNPKVLTAVLTLPQAGANPEARLVVVLKRQGPDESLIWSLEALQSCNPKFSKLEKSH